MQKETISIDVEKLQLLNDRIAQTLEALNQLQLSARNWAHTQNFVGPQFVPQTTPYTQHGYGYAPVNTSFYGQPVQNQWNGPVNGQWEAGRDIRWENRYDARFSHAPTAPVYGAPVYGQPVHFEGDRFATTGRVDMGRDGFRSDIELAERQRIERERMAREQAAFGTSFDRYESNRW